MSSSVIKKVLVGITAYDGKLDILGMLSLLNNIDFLKKTGWTVDIQCQVGDCYIEQARNHLVDKFLKGDFTDMIFVDNDLSYENEAMYKLLKLPCQVVGGTYPYRGEQEGYPIAIKLDENNVPIGNVELGIIECTHVPTGLMRIRRDTFVKLKEAYPYLKGENDKGEEEWKFFLTGMLFQSEGDNRFYGEDVFFCKICDKAGIKVWCEPRITFSHIGRAGRIGNYDQYLRTVGKAAVAK